MNDSKSIYLAASKVSLPLVLYKVPSGGMMERLTGDYKYRLVIPCNKGSSIDIYLTKIDLYNGIYKAIQVLNATRKPTESIVTNNVAYNERGYYRYSQYLPELHIFKRGYKLILKLKYTILNGDIIIHPKIYHKIFFFQHKSKVQPIKDLCVPNHLIDQTLIILQDYVFLS